jgi:hypothetical protein
MVHGIVGTDPVGAGLAFFKILKLVGNYDLLW